jgi:hypothetical protein
MEDPMSLFDDMPLAELRTHLAFWQDQAANTPWDKLGPMNMISRLEALIADKEASPSSPSSPSSPICTDFKRRYEDLLEEHSKTLDIMEGLKQFARHTDSCQALRMADNSNWGSNTKVCTCGLASLLT